MRKIISATLLALVAASPAVAQDAARFTGPRVEGLIGWNRMQGHGHDDGFAYGVGGGYDFQAGNAIVGIDAEVMGANNKACVDNLVGPYERICQKVGRDLYIGGRAGGVVSPNLLLYGKIGYSNAREKLRGDDGILVRTIDKRDLSGIRLGGGAEYAIGSNSYVKAEYRYTNYNHGDSRHQILGGFGFRF